MTAEDDTSGLGLSTTIAALDGVVPTDVAIRRVAPHLNWVNEARVRQVEACARAGLDPV